MIHLVRLLRVLLGEVLEKRWYIRQEKHISVTKNVILPANETVPSESSSWARGALFRIDVILGRRNILT